MDSSLVTLFLIIGLLSGTAMGILTGVCLPRFYDRLRQARRVQRQSLRSLAPGAASVKPHCSGTTRSSARLDASQREMSPLRPACFNTLSLAGRALCDDGRHLLCPPSSINDNVTGAFSVLLVCTRTQRDRSAALPFTRQAHATVTVGWPVV